MMEHIWFVRDGNVIHGPLNRRELELRLTAGEFGPHALLRRGDTREWTALSSVQRPSGSSPQRILHTGNAIAFVGLALGLAMLASLIWLRQGRPTFGMDEQPQIAAAHESTPAAIAPVEVNGAVEGAAATIATDHGSAAESEDRARLEIPATNTSSESPPAGVVPQPPAAEPSVDQPTAAGRAGNESLRSAQTPVACTEATRRYLTALQQLALQEHRSQRANPAFDTFSPTYFARRLAVLEKALAFERAGVDEDLLAIVDETVELARELKRYSEESFAHQQVQLLAGAANAFLGGSILEEAAKASAGPAQYQAELGVSWLELGLELEIRWDRFQCRLEHGPDGPSLSDLVVRTHMCGCALDAMQIGASGDSPCSFARMLNAEFIERTTRLTKKFAESGASITKLLTLWQASDIYDTRNALAYWNIASGIGTKSTNSAHLKILDRQKALLRTVCLLGCEPLVRRVGLGAIQSGQFSATLGRALALDVSTIAARSGLTQELNRQMAAREELLRSLGCDG